MLAIPLVILEHRLSFESVRIFGSEIIVHEIFFKHHLSFEIQSSPPEHGFRELGEHRQALLRFFFVVDLLRNVIFVAIPAVQIQLAFISIFT